MYKENLVIWVRIDNDWFFRISVNSPAQPVLTWNWSFFRFCPTSKRCYSFYETLVSWSISKDKILTFLQASQLLCQQDEFRELSQITAWQNLLESYIIDKPFNMFIKFSLIMHLHWSFGESFINNTFLGLSSQNLEHVTLLV